ncbi:MAG: (2Fe-2S)-binding protein [Pseudomonadota bacterium]
MYVCLCHGFTERQVKAAIEESGAGSASAVYKHFSCAPRCGKCVPFVRDMVKAGKSEGAGGCNGRCDGSCGCSGVASAG